MTGAVVVTHNSAKTITACLASLREAGCREIIVVDNASTDATTSADMTGVRLVRNPTNNGFGAAGNQGAAILTTPYVLFLNPDAALLPTALSVAEAYVRDEPQVGGLGLQLLDDRGRAQRDNWGNEVTLGSLLWRKIRPLPLATNITACAWVSGGALLVRRDAFIAAGGFDPGFFMYWEDVDLCRRLRALGWKIVFMPQAQVKHQRGHSAPDLRSKTAWYDQSADRYFRKHYATTIWLLQRWGRRCYRYLVPRVR